jgi:hypothetical protein
MGRRGIVILANTKLVFVFVGVSLVVGAAILVVIILSIGNPQQTKIFILNQNIEPTIKQWDNQTLIGDQIEVRESWTGNRSAIIPIGSYSFNYTAKELGVYEMYFVNAWESQDPVIISLEYDAPQRDMKGETLSIPYRSLMQFSEKMEADERIQGHFNVTGHPSQGILFYFMLPKCSQSLSFSFVLANTDRDDHFTSVKLKADGTSVWTADYNVEAGKIKAVRETAKLDDCDEHSFSIQLG